MDRAIKKSYTVSIPIDGGEVNFPQDLEVKNKEIIGVLAHLNDANDTRTNLVGSKLVKRSTSVFVRLEGDSSCDTRLLFLPLEALNVEGKSYAFVPLSINSLLLANCSLKVANFSPNDAGRVVMLTFFTQ